MISLRWKTASLLILNETVTVCCAFLAQYPLQANKIKIEDSELFLFLAEVLQQCRAHSYGAEYRPRGLLIWKEKHKTRKVQVMFFDSYKNEKNSWKVKKKEKCFLKISFRFTPDLFKKIKS